MTKLPAVGDTVYEWNSSYKTNTFEFPGTKEPVVFAVKVTKVTATGFTTEDGKRYIAPKYSNSGVWALYGTASSYHTVYVRSTIPDGARAVTRAEFQAAGSVISEAKRNAADEARKMALAEDGIWRTVAKTVRNHGGSFGCHSELLALKSVIPAEQQNEFVEALMSELSDTARKLRDAADTLDSLASRATMEAKNYRQTLG